MDTKDNVREDKVQSQLTIESAIEELEAKIAPGQSENHNETLLQESW